MNVLPSKKLAILVVSYADISHVNGCSGAVLELVRRGHRVVYILDAVMAGKLAPLGFEEYLINEVASENLGTPGQKTAKNLMDYGFIGAGSPLEKMTKMVNEFQKRPQFCTSQMKLNENLKTAIARLNPDVIVYDLNFLLPAVYFSGIPWIKMITMTPLYRYTANDLPPPGSGLPENDRSQWFDYDHVRHWTKFSSICNDIVEQMGYPRYPDDQRSPETQILTVYAYPDEINFDQFRWKPNWFNLEVFNKPLVSKTDLTEIVPDCFLKDDLNGKFTRKLIYFSMGSIVPYDVPLMRRLVKTLSKTNHKYIVSRGHRSEEYQLPVNMWGDCFLSQMAILPHVDLVICHGGHNTFTETFAHGKPMVVMPICFDQFNNAQRIHETGFGVRVDPYLYEDEELIKAIDKLLSDDKLKQRLMATSDRIQAENKHEQLAHKIEQLLD